MTVLELYSGGRKQEPFYTGFLERGIFQANRFGYGVTCTEEKLLSMVDQGQTALFPWKDSCIKVLKQLHNAGIYPL